MRTPFLISLILYTAGWLLWAMLLALGSEAPRKIEWLFPVRRKWLDYLLYGIVAGLFAAATLLVAVSWG